MWGWGWEWGSTTIPRGARAQSQRTCGKGEVIYTYGARDPSSLFAPASLGLAGSDGISPDRQGPGDDVRWGGALPQVGVRTCSGAALPAEGAKGAGVRRRRKARSLRRSFGHGSGRPRSIGEEAAPWSQGTGGPETPTHRGCRKHEDGGGGPQVEGEEDCALRIAIW